MTNVPKTKYQISPSLRPSGPRKVVAGSQGRPSSLPYPPPHRSQKRALGRVLRHPLLREASDRCQPRTGMWVHRGSILGHWGRDRLGSRGDLAPHGPPQDPSSLLWEEDRTMG